MEEFIENFAKNAIYFNYKIIRLNNDSLAFFIDREPTEYGYPYFSVKIHNKKIYINEFLYKGFPHLKNMKKQISFFGDYIGYLETINPELYLIFCHTKIISNNFELNNLEVNNAKVLRGHPLLDFITQIDMNYYNTIFVTVDKAESSANIIEDAFSEKFISANEGVFDAIALPDCAGPWSDNQGYKNNDGLIKIVHNVSRLVKKNGSVLLGKILDTPTKILGQEYEKYSHYTPDYGPYIKFNK